MHLLILPTTYVNSHNKTSSLFVKNQAEALQKKGLKIGIVCSLPISLKKIQFKNVLNFFYDVKIVNCIKTILFTFPSVPKIRIINDFIRFIIGKILIKKYIKENGIPDIIHVHNYIVGNLAIWMKKKYSVPFVITEHSSAFYTNGLSLKQLKLASYNYSMSNLNISVSLGFSEFLTKKMGSVFFTLPNVVDTNYFTINKKNDNTNDFTFTNIGYLDKNKNQILLIRAFLDSFKGDVNKKLIIAGEGPERKKILKYISKFDFFGQVKVLNSLDRISVRNILNKSNCLVVSSSIETFSVISIEALSCGIPVVAIRSIGPSFIISEDSYGMLSSKDNLRKALRDIYLNRKKYISNDLRNYAVENFSDNIISSKLIKIYKSLK